jgi:4-alpha-glucanotransferase
MRWERYWEGDKSFIDPQDYIRESMTTVSTHDSKTLSLWWKNSPEEAKIYAESKRWTYDPEMTPEQQFSILYDSHHTPSLFHINLLQEYLALIPGMTWPDPADERINIPGLVLEKNWTYRFRPYVEEIVTDDRLKNTMKQILEK